MTRDRPALMAESALIEWQQHTHFGFHNSERGRAMDEEQTRQQDIEPTIDEMLMMHQVQSMMLLLEEYPALFYGAEELVEFMDGLVENGPDEGFKARWRSGRPRFEKLIEVAKRKAAGLQLDT
jgi:hypothetical protein